MSTEDADILELALDAFVSTDLKGRIIGWNAKAEQMFGWSRDEIRGRYALETLVPPESAETYHTQILRILHIGRSMQEPIETVLLHKSGSTLPVEVITWTLGPGRDDGAALAWFVRDISSRKAAEDALVTSERTLAEATALASIGHWQWDVISNEVRWSDQSYLALGLVPGQIEPGFEAFMGRVHAADRDKVLGHISAGYDAPQRFEHRVVTPDGGLRWVAEHLSAERNERGEVVRLFGAIQDVTERKLNENQSRWYAALVASSSDAIIGTDMEGAILSWNEGAQTLFGYSSDEIIGSSTSVLCPREQLAELEDLERRLSIGEVMTGYETYRLRKDGHCVPVSISASAVHDDGGAIIGASAIIRDITATVTARTTLRRALEQERAAVVKLQELDRAKTTFVSCVSHELRTPLTSILGYLEVIQDDPDGLSEEQREFIEIIDRNSQRLLGLIEDLLILSRIESGASRVRKEAVGVQALVDRAVSAVRDGRPNDAVGIVVEVEQGASTVMGDELELERLLVHLVENAVKFSLGGASVRVRARHTEEGKEITVTDAGTGIAAQDLRQVFMPFFRTADAVHRAIRGTGLGLAIVAEIVRQHGGTIRCSSQVGQGTTMTVVLPVDDVDAEEAA